MRHDEAWHAVVELAASRHGVFHAGEAAERGVSQDRLRRGLATGELRRPIGRVYTLASAPDSRDQRLHVAAAATRSRGLVDVRAVGAISHVSAAAVHGLVEQHPETISLWVPTQVRLRGSPYEVHRGGPLDVDRDLTSVDGLPVVGRAASVCQLGAAQPGLLDRALDTFSRESSMAWLGETADLWRAHDPRSVAALDRALADPRRHRGVTDSWFERVVAGLLRRRDLPPIETQYEVEIDGRRYRIDIAIPEVLLGVEAHSRQFHWGPDATDADNVRDLHLSTAGWQLLYVTWWQSQHPDEFVDHIVAAVHRRLALGLVRR